MRKGVLCSPKDEISFSNGIMEKTISLIIPNYNGSSTIGKCLDAAFASKYGNFEVIVVDDGSVDNSVEIIKKYPCRLVRMEKHAGAGAARNRGAKSSRGEVLFFTDADCLLRNDALLLANEAVAENPGAVIGGTYTPLPYDHDFFSVFQSLFVHYSETKKKEPDYIATHALIIDAGMFKSSGGFSEDFLPILEDVEFSHRLSRNGLRLLMAPEIQVMHVFNFTVSKALQNAFRKTTYWTMYAVANRDLFADSGTASVELKINGASFSLVVFLVLLFFIRHQPGWLFPLPFLLAANLVLSSGLLTLFYRSKGLRFTVIGGLYYTMIYPFPVIAGGLAGLVKHGLIRGNKKVTMSQPKNKIDHEERMD